MKIKPFELERYFARYEFSAPYHLSSSDCEALSLKELLAMADEDTLQLWEELKLGYTESPGHPLLRKEISKLYQTIEPEQILVTVPEEGIFIAMNTLLGNGDHIISTFPAYQSLYEIACSMGCEISKWTPTNDIGWHFKIDDLKPLIRRNTKLIVINFPHNPTGAIISENELQELLMIARERNIIVFSDEMYRFLEYDSAHQTSSASDLYENAISLFGMSKSFALAGLRIGWLSTKNSDFLKSFAAYKDYTSICSSAPSEILAIIALRVKENILHRNLQLIAKNLKILDKFFAKYEDIFEWLRPQAGPIAFPKFKPQIDVADFCLNLVEKNGVMLLPSKVYDFKANYFRIGFARKNMPEALDQLEQYLQTHLRGSKRT
ncbi:MAG TPA: aminotransferase class I/II-fold pyridoxal phosphate-dependent enzyme [Candidatus Marinimicrobia bacterium]|nr:aminotransferase class I/II-fold pyridoxal phosphate-dependent enzyme [Candidatus Neomarinimicrobiota bacterium]